MTHMITWKQLRSWLDDIYNQRSYYIGGTLCVDFDGGFVGLNVSGKGFIVLEELKEIKFSMPSDIKEKVRVIYRDFKGREPHPRMLEK